MCQFFSFVGDGYGNYLYSDWNRRKIDLSENWDSHTKILTDNNVPPIMQDRWSKYEYNPIIMQFTIDEPVDGHDHEAAENWVKHLDFKRIVAPLIIKKIVYPLTGRAKKVTEKEIQLLKEWASVRASVMASVRASVMDSVWDSVGASVMASVRASVMDSVWDSVGASVWASVVASVLASVGDSVGDSVWDSVWAYFSSFFDIKYNFDFSSCIKLWESVFVPSFDGKTWRLHSGKKAKIVYEWRKEK